MRGLVIAVDFWTGFADVASALAALAALAAVIYARATVAEAREGRRDAAAQHAAVLAEQQRTAAATEAAQEETRRAANEARRAYDEERAATARALAMQRTLRRIEQIDRIAQLLGSLANLARDEAANAPPTVGLPGFPLTRIPTVLGELRIAVALHSALGGAELANVAELAANGYAHGQDPMQFVGRAGASLNEIAWLVESDERYVAADQDT